MKTALLFFFAASVFIVGFTMLWLTPYEFSKNLAALGLPSSFLTGGLYELVGLFLFITSIMVLRKIHQNF